MDIRVPLFRDESTPEFQGDTADLPASPTGASHLSLGGVNAPMGNGHSEGGGVTRLVSISEANVMDGPPDRDADGNEHGGAAVGPHVHMDAMAFGMGCCCLQVTFQVKVTNGGRVPSVLIIHMLFSFCFAVVVLT